MTQLDLDQRDWIKRSIQSAGIDATDPVVEELNRGVNESIEAFRLDQKLTKTDRQDNDALREIYKLSTRAKPNIANLRKRLANLSLDNRHYLDERASRIWEMVGELPKPHPAGGFIAWSATAPLQTLIDAIDVLIVEGGVRVPVRKRKGTSPGQTRLEPTIRGVARGEKRTDPPKSDTLSRLGYDSAPTNPSNGRRPNYEIDHLIWALATDWLMATEVLPERGRSGTSGFADLVHHVFGWVGSGKAEQALRRYWEIVTPEIVAALERGEEVS